MFGWNVLIIRAHHSVLFGFDPSFCAENCRRQKARHSELGGLGFRPQLPDLRRYYEGLPVVVPAPPLLPLVDALLPMLEPCMLLPPMSLWLPPTEPP